MFDWIFYERERETKRVVEIGLLITYIDGSFEFIGLHVDDRRIDMVEGAFEVGEDILELYLDRM